MPASPETPGFVALHGGDARLEVVPELGGRVRSLRVAGREWLLDGAGWEECAPAAEDESRGQPVAAEVSTTPEGPRVTCTWEGSTLPWRMTRSLVVHHSGTIVASYEASTSGAKRIPFAWSALLPLPLSSTTQVTCAEGARLRFAALGIARKDGAPHESVGRWPRMTLDGKVRDLSRPWGAPTRCVVSGWIDLNGLATVEVAEGKASLAIVVDAADIPCLGLVIDRGGRETTRRGALSFLTRRGAPALALRPSLRAPERVVEGLGDALSTTWLTPGEPRRWTMTIRGGA